MGLIVTISAAEVALKSLLIKNIVMRSDPVSDKKDFIISCKVLLQNENPQAFLQVGGQQIYY